MPGADNPEEMVIVGNHRDAGPSERSIQTAEQLAHQWLEKLRKNLVFERVIVALSRDPTDQKSRSATHQRSLGL